jgi:hypothetical protein
MKSGLNMTLLKCQCQHAWIEAMPLAHKTQSPKPSEFAHSLGTLMKKLNALEQQALDQLRLWG